MKKIIVMLLSILILFSGCAKLSVTERDTQRSKIDAMAKETVAELIKDNPSIQKELDNAVGYGVINWKVTKVPVFGAGGGDGVIIDLRDNKHTYIDVRRFDVGGGWGARSYKNLVIIHNNKLLDDALNGDIKFEAGAEASAGTVGAEGGSGMLNKKITTHVLLDGGGSATATVRVLYSTLNSDLN